jgi:hypothetical protein
MPIASTVFFAMIVFPVADGGCPANADQGDPFRKSP